jgi:hypothetical protein
METTTTTAAAAAAAAAAATTTTTKTKCAPRIFHWGAYDPVTTCNLCLI